MLVSLCDAAPACETGIIFPYKRPTLTRAQRIFVDALCQQSFLNLIELFILYAAGAAWNS
ncbi:MAG: hypothetical protein WCJ99_18570 [Betaproteobacteria bacterium]